MFASVAAGGSGLRIIDISEPASPFEVGIVDTPDDARGVADEGPGLQILDFWPFD
ncbi:MAG: hypothetical protein IMZ55_01820 [Acidobacteria bacterium]|nr:hypothetical protein [Acidobacteriota bacterium]